MNSVAIAGWLAHYGYWAVAVGVFAESAGVPVPGETVLLAAAALTARGQLSLPWVIAVAAVASVLGDNLGFALGRRLGRGWLERHGRWVLLTPPRLVRMDAFFDRFGAPAVGLARFVAGVRVVAAFAAGTSRMRWGTFLLFNVLGAVAWAVAVGLVGAALGHGYTAVAATGGRVGVVVVLAVLVLVGGAWLVRRAVRARRDGAGAFTWPGWVERLGGHVVATAAAAFGATWAFAALAEEVAESETATLDLAVRTWALAHRAPVLDVLFRGATWAGSTLRLVPAVALVAWWLWRRRGRGAAAFVILAPAAASLLVVGLKLLFHRARPEGALGLGLGYSFPSGHSTASAAVACTVAYVLVRERLAPRIALVIAGAFALVVGLSRVYLDVHWATDVVGGWTVGAGIAMLSAALYERVSAAARAAGQAAEERGSVDSSDRPS